MILYHGSNMVIDKIDFEMSKPNKDFGKGFYLYENESQAMEMANFKSALLGGEPIVTKFEFNDLTMQSPDLRIKILQTIQRSGLILCSQIERDMRLSSMILYMVLLQMTR